MRAINTGTSIYLPENNFDYERVTRANFRVLPRLERSQNSTTYETIRSCFLLILQQTVFAVSFYTHHQQIFTTEHVLTSFVLLFVFACCFPRSSGISLNFFLIHQYHFTSVQINIKSQFCCPNISFQNLLHYDYDPIFYDVIVFQIHVNISPLRYTRNPILRFEQFFQHEIRFNFMFT